MKVQMQLLCCTQRGRDKYTSSEEYSAVDQSNSHTHTLAIASQFIRLRKTVSNSDSASTESTATHGRALRALCDDKQSTHKLQYVCGKHADTYIMHICIYTMNANSISLSQSKRKLFVVLMDVDWFATHYIAFIERYHSLAHRLLYASLIATLAPSTRRSHTLPFVFASICIAHCRSAAHDVFPCRCYCFCCT